MRHRLFYDSSALYTAAYSLTGASRELLRWAIQGKVQVHISQDVLDETGRNLMRKAPETISAYKELLLQIDPEVIADPTKEEVWDAEKYVAKKDAPIVAAAKNAKVDFLVTLDKKHLLGKPEIAKYVGAAIVTPKEAVTRLRFTN